MKLSLAWIFDHIDANWQQQDVAEIARRFNKTTAELEHTEAIKHDLTPFFMGTVTAPGSVLLPELKVTAEVKGAQSGHYLIKKTGDTYRLAAHADFGSEKEGALPPFEATPEQLLGSWRNSWQAHDVIIEVDNKSITHRPDMWGHRGFAREIAAFMGLSMRPVEQFLTEIPVLSYDKTSGSTATCPIIITNEAPQACSRFTGLYFSKIDNKRCDFFVASRLLNIGARPIDGLVDLTNYLMNDWGRPVHAYDADKLTDSTVTIRMARHNETMKLLGGDEITLTDQDAVIASGQAPVCLAGVRGGLDSGVSATTTRILLEAAQFDAGYIRRSAQRHKNRTDSSTRFEKTPDLDSVAQAAPRFLSLLKQFGYQAELARELISVGKVAEPVTIDVPHAFLETRIGMALVPAQITEILTRLEFGVTLRDGVYHIAVPAFRASKDVKIKEDILEEIVRSIGFDQIEQQLPRILRTPYATLASRRWQKIKHVLAYGLGMTEQQNYALADQPWLESLGVLTAHPLSLINPVAQTHRDMISSLVPGLLKNIRDNHQHRDQLAFFECGRVWSMANGNLAEQRQVAGLFFKKRGELDFYACKRDVTALLTALDLGSPDKLTWQKTMTPWYHEHQAAQILYAGKPVGVIGRLSPALATKLEIDAPCDVFMFELDGDFLITEVGSQPRYTPISKFQETYVDLSLMVPLARLASDIVTCLRNVSPLVERVEQIDCFENKSWTDVRSLTYRLWLVSHEKTLEKHEIDAVWQQATQAVGALGAQVRTS